MYEIKKCNKGVEKTIYLKTLMLLFTYLFIFNKAHATIKRTQAGMVLFLLVILYQVRFEPELYVPYSVMPSNFLLTIVFIKYRVSIKECLTYKF